jgi:rubrerythrin
MEKARKLIGIIEADMFDESRDIKKYADQSYTAASVGSPEVAQLFTQLSNEEKNHHERLLGLQMQLKKVVLR